MSESQSLAYLFAMKNRSRTMYDLYCDIVGKQIRNLGLIDDQLMFIFTDGQKVAIEDDMQNCCENRYMRTDDVLADYMDAKLIGIELKEANTIDDKNIEQHDVWFLEVVTSKGSFTCSFHNEHNGYYAGFNPILKVV